MQGNETILLVDDEEGVRRLSASILRRQGFQVLEAESGKDALRVVEENKGAEIHLLLSDMSMPDLDGQELAKRLRETRPDLKVLLTSGLSEEDMEHEKPKDLGMAFIQKPFSSSSLTLKIKELLG